MITLTALLAGSAAATEIGGARPFGLGIQLGTPSGLTGKFYFGGRRNALDFTIGAAYADRYFWGGFYGEVAYHWHITELTSGQGVAIPFRVGIGGFLTTGYNDWWGNGPIGAYDVLLGARVPVGLDFDLEMAPVQFYIELGIGLTVLPPLYPWLDGGIGARYYF